MTSIASITWMRVVFDHAILGETMCEVYWDR